MKNIYLIIVVFILFPFIVEAQNYKGNVLCEIKSFESTASAVNVALAISIKGEIVDNCESRVFIPTLESNTKSQMYPYVLVHGSNKKHMLKRWYSLRGKNNQGNYLGTYAEINSSKNTDTTVIYNIQVPRSDWKNLTRLIIREETFGCNNVIQVAEYTIDNDILQLAVAETLPPQVITPPVAAEKSSEMEKEIFFHLNRTEIDFSYHNNYQEAQDIVRLINDRNLEIEAIHITGYASPEGPYNNNERLAIGRAASLKRYILENTPVSERVFSMNFVPENWEELVVLLRQSDLSNKYGIISIIENSSISEREREKYIRMIDNNLTYNRLLKEYYPELRKVECRIYYKNATARAVAENTEQPVQSEEFIFY